jgi:hypothetical protein
LQTGASGFTQIEHPLFLSFLVSVDLRTQCNVWNSVFKLVISI